MTTISFTGVSVGRGDGTAVGVSAVAWPPDARVSSTTTIITATNTIPATTPTDGLDALALVRSVIWNGRTGIAFSACAFCSLMCSGGGGRNVMMIVSRDGSMLLAVQPTAILVRRGAGDYRGYWQ